MLRSLTLTVTTTVALALAVPAALADDLTSVYAQIIADPGNAELNLQYAMIAEGRHEYRKALSAYERILVNDPTNEAARRGMQRVRRIIQPAETQKTFEVGVAWQSNPERMIVGNDDVYGYANFRIKDERPFAGHRWRTNLNFYNETYAELNDMNYAAISGDVGPIIDIDGTNVSVRPGIGGGTAWLGGRNYYWDVNASALFEGHLNGAYQWLRVRAGYRQYDPWFTSGNGTYVDVSARLAMQDVFHDHDALSLSPWFRWSGIDGLPDNGATDFATGQYIEGGAKLEYSKAISDRLSASVNVRVSDRLYDDIGSGSRRDWLVSPGASLVFTNLFGPSADLRLDYSYAWNDSNMTDHTWQNQTATVAFVVRR